MSDFSERIKKRIEARKWKITDDAFVSELIGMQYANNMNDWCLEIIDEESAKEQQEQPIEQFTGLELANIAVALKQLQYYEDLAEKGLLVELPCKVGDTVYVKKECFSEWYTFLEFKPYVLGEVVNFKYTKSGISAHIRPLTERAMCSRYHKFFGIASFGKTVFLTQSEAEQALADTK